MPAILEQLAGSGHDHRSQLGWGATLKSHWGPDLPINGLKQENAHLRYQDATAAVTSGQFDALVLTGMVEIKDTIKYFDSPVYLRKWARLARDPKFTTRVYLYEPWHQLDHSQGWLQRLDDHLPRHWEGELLAKALAYGDTGGPIHVIPAGQGRSWLGSFGGSSKAAGCRACHPGRACLHWPKTAPETTSTQMTLAATWSP